MILLITVFTLILMARSLWGWDVPVSQTRLLPKKRARLLTLFLLPVFFLVTINPDEAGTLFKVACLTYGVLFAFSGIILSKKRCNIESSAAISFATNSPEAQASSSVVPKGNLSGGAMPLRISRDSDDSEFAKCCLKLAEEGDAEAQYQLGVAYANGIGLPKDDVLAYMWWNLAAAAGIEAAGKKRDLATKKMKSEQVAEAQRLSREWKAQK